MAFQHAVVLFAVAAIIDTPKGFRLSADGGGGGGGGDGDFRWS